MTQYMSNRIQEESLPRNSSSKPPIRIMLVEDQVTVRAGLCLLLHSRPGFQVVGEAGSGPEALALAARELPDIILLDLNLSGADGLELIPELLATSPRSRLLILTGEKDGTLHQQAVCQGAMGVVRKEQAVDILFQSITRVQTGEIWLDRLTTANVLRELARTREQRSQDPEALKQASLTEREREVIALVGEGLKNRQIGDRLFISETTVRHHLTSIFSKLEVPDRLGLVIYAHQHGLVKLPLLTTRAARASAAKIS